ncbi:hypothetical protein JQ632_25865 [Bradyrhizobium liaoningense]|nr:hypothetical protein [Bradyrhizobium liaoningense]
MRLRCVILAALVAVLAALPQARAAAEHTYPKDGYAIIIGGWAPNKRLTIATHGVGQGRHDNLHLYLLAEPGRRPLATLDGIGPDNNFDTDPDVFYAAWSPDSHYVAVSFRNAREIGTEIWSLYLYVVEAGRARRIDVPDLFRELTGRTVEFKAGGDMKSNFPTVEWRSPRRFRLNDPRTFIRDDTALADKFSDFSLLTRMKDGRYKIHFAVKANVTLGRGDRYRLGPLRQGAFRE